MLKLPPRWREPLVPPREALLLLPRLPAAAWNGSTERWTEALSSLGIPLLDSPGALGQHDLLVEDQAGRASGLPADQVLLNGRDRAGRLRRAGYSVQTYTTHGAAGGVVRLAPLRTAAGFRWRPSRPGGRALLVALVRRLCGRRYVTLAHRGPLTPAAVAAAGLETTGAVLLAGGGGARRRSTLLVPAAKSRPAAAVKVAPGSDRDRGLREQGVLRRLAGLADLSSAVPRPLGEGTLGPLSWSAESALVGRPLPDSLRRLGATRSLRLLQDLAEWFTRLAELTRAPGSSWDARRSTLPLRGEHSGLADLRHHLEGVPGVLVHGDVGTGGNVLVGRAGFGIIDWETARDTELPLTDLLPLLCLALAGGRSPDGQARYALSLCAGQESHSDWLLRIVRGYCRRVGVRPEQAGPLGALAWGYQASMRLVHEELVTAAGATPSHWVSPAEQVARSWDSYPGLGPTWPALTAGWPR